MAAELDEKMMAMALRMQNLAIPDHVIEDLIGVRPAPIQVQDEDDDDDREETAATEEAETISV